MTRRYVDRSQYPTLSKGLADPKLTSYRGSKNTHHGMADINISEEAPADSFFPTELKYITGILQPLEELLRKACYMSEKSRGVGHIALKFIQRNKAPVLVRYLMKIRECHTWISDMPHLGLRFEHHLDGKGIDKFMRTGLP
jgi:hypothetical protein